MYHFGDREAPDAVSLMRSRYAAYCVGDAAYLWRTLHTGHEDRARNKEEVVRELKDAMHAHKYRGLKILDNRGGGSSGTVLFLAKVFEGGTDKSFVELSDFLHDGTGWRYLCGVGMACSRLKLQPEKLTIDTFSALVR